MSGLSRGDLRAAILALLAVAVLSAPFGDGLAQSGGSFDVRRSTVDAGGGRSTGGAFEITGTAGQPDVGVSSGGTFEFRGGFWAGPAPSDAPDVLFSNGFEPTAGTP
jgi:hypothetical protein